MHLSKYFAIPFLRQQGGGQGDGANKQEHVRHVQSET